MLAGSIRSQINQVWNAFWLGGIFNTLSVTEQLILNLMACVALFEREMMLERQKEGIQKAKADGKYTGRKPKPRIIALVACKWPLVRLYDLPMRCAVDGCQFGLCSFWYLLNRRPELVVEVNSPRVSRYFFPNLSRRLILPFTETMEEKAAMTHCDDPKEIGFFIGDEIAFSDCLLKLTSAEFSSLQFIRIPTLNSALSTSDVQAAQCRIIIVNDSLVDDLRASLPAISAHFAKANVVLSYRHAPIAEAFLRDAANDPALVKVGVLPMQLEMVHWMSVLRMLICGERYIPYELFHAFPPKPNAIGPAPAQQQTAQESAPAKPPCLLARLTDREMQVLTSVSMGKQNKVIAAEMDLSEHTVKLHIHNVISKLGVNNRTEAAVFYLGATPKPNGGLLQ
ncbi:LuxR C-terminal-related transcriptional regulator [Pseudorhodobacter sp. W20_MBD10_FR17]|uniref:helix-turn-helix transcriptional regulator n=1 Tax=Pseudorhodobacter sp. W20_MBD10_FR17 TaxID=3240266 RepID=UPI003F95E2FA